VELPLGKLTHRGQQPMGHQPPVRRGHAKHPLHPLGEHLDAEQQRVAQAGRKFATIRRGRQQLLAEERVSFRALIEPAHKRRIRVAAENAAQLRGQLIRREAAQLQPLDHGARIVLGQKRPQPMAPMQRVRAIAACQQQPLLARVAYQEREEIERRSVRPVNVLDRQQQRRVLSEAGEHPRDQLEQAHLRERFTGRPLRRFQRPGSAELGHQPRELLPTASEQLVQDIRIELPHQAPERRSHRRIRKLALRIAHAIAAQHPGAAPPRRAGQLTQQPALTDARVTRREHRAELAPRRTLQRCRHRRQLRAPSHELGTRHTPRHPQIIPPAGS
jgi:hypothetical protein